MDDLTIGEIFKALAEQEWPDSPDFATSIAHRPWVNPRVVARLAVEQVEDRARYNYLTFALPNHGYAEPYTDQRDFWIQNAIEETHIDPGHYRAVVAKLGEKK